MGRFTIIRQWLPVLGLTLSAFVFNTSEFIPIGLLTDIAGDFNVGEAQAGMLISVYAWIVALMSLPLMMLVSKMEYRKLLFGTTLLFMSSQLLSAVAENYSVLMVSRIGVACAHSVFWGIASPLAVRTAPEGKSSAALGMIVTGTSIAMIVGLPLGRVIGLYMNWRLTFVCIALSALLILLLLAVVFPKIPNTHPMTLHKLPSLFRNKALTAIFLFTLLTATAHYTAYSYIEPFLGRMAGLGEDLITGVLVVIGLSGIAGSVLFSRGFSRSPHRFFCFTSGGMAVSLLLLRPSTSFAATVILLCFFWGIAYTVFNLMLQFEIIRFAPQATTIAMAIYSGIFNLGIGCGTMVGGIVCSSLSIAYIGYVGGIIGILAWRYCSIKMLQIL